MSISISALQGPIVWITHVPSRTIVDCSPELAKALGAEMTDLLDKYLPYKGRDSQGAVWYSESRAAAERVNDEVVKTGRTDTRKFWMKMRDAKKIRQFIITRSALDAQHTLAVCHDITNNDVRLTWLEKVDFEKRVLALPNGSNINFTEISTLGLYVRGHSYKYIARVLHISISAVKKRLVNCRLAFGCATLEDLRTEIAVNGLTNLLLVPIQTPLSEELSLADVLSQIERF